MGRVVSVFTWVNASNMVVFSARSSLAAASFLRSLRFSSRNRPCVQIKRYMNEVEVDDSRYWHDARARPRNICALDPVLPRAAATAQTSHGPSPGHPSRSRPVESLLVCWLRILTAHSGEKRPRSVPSICLDGFYGVLSAVPRFLVSGFQLW